MTAKCCHCIGDNTLDICPRYSYIGNESRSPRTPSGRVLFGGWGECGACGRGHTLRSRAARASSSRHYDRDARCSLALARALRPQAPSQPPPQAGEGKAAVARRDYPPRLDLPGGAASIRLNKSDKCAPGSSSMSFRIAELSYRRPFLLQPCRRLRGTAA
jgi:hypothetical protein